MMILNRLVIAPASNAPHHESSPPRHSSLTGVRGFRNLRLAPNLGQLPVPGYPIDLTVGQCDLDRGSPFWTHASRANPQGFQRLEIAQVEKANVRNLSAVQLQ